MTTLTDSTVSCPAEPLLHLLLEEIKSIRQTLKEKTPKPKKSIDSLYVNEFVLAFLLSKPEKEDWKSGDLAEEIGCSPAAVRKTKAWKGYQATLQSKKQDRPPHKGYKDEWGNLEAYDTDDDRDEWDK